MSVPPWIMHLHVRNIGSRGFGIWLPLFLAWPLFILIALLLMPFVLLAAAFLWPGGNGKRVLLFCLALPRLLVALRGLNIDVKQDRTRFHIAFV